MSTILSIFFLKCNFFLQTELRFFNTFIAATTSLILSLKTSEPFSVYVRQLTHFSPSNFVYAGSKFPNE